MEVNIFNYDSAIDLILVNKIKKLQQIIRTDCILNVHFINGKYSLLRWASNHKFNEMALNVFIMDKNTHLFVSHVIRASYIIILNRDNERVKNIDKIVRFILSKDTAEDTFKRRGQVVLTESDVQILFHMFMNNQPLGKHRWSAKKRVKQKLGFKDDHEMYLWWRLAETLPAELIRNQIRLMNY